MGKYGRSHRDGWIAGKTSLVQTLLEQSGLTHCSLRLGGIYGPDRDYLIRQVLSGLGGSSEFTNRIHEQDAGRVIAFLLEKLQKKESLPKCLVVCDSDPEASNIVRSFIAEQMGLDASQLEPSASGRGGNKRCRNDKLLSLGFTLNYPSYQDGYRR